jgi:hypothetical protein
VWSLSYSHADTDPCEHQPFSLLQHDLKCDRASNKVASELPGVPSQRGVVTLERSWTQNGRYERYSEPPLQIRASS